MPLTGVDLLVKQFRFAIAMPKAISEVDPAAARPLMERVFSSPSRYEKTRACEKGQLGPTRVYRPKVGTALKATAQRPRFIQRPCSAGRWRVMRPGRVPLRELRSTSNPARAPESFLSGFNSSIDRFNRCKRDEKRASAE